LLSSGGSAIIAIMLIRVALAATIAAAVAFATSIVFPKASYHKNPRSDTPLFRFEKNGRVGFINDRGEVKIHPKFDVGWFAEEDFVEGLSPARSGRNWGFIDTKGNWVIKAKYKNVEPFSEGLAAVNGHIKDFDFPFHLPNIDYIDKNGATIIRLPEDVYKGDPFSEGMAVVSTYGGQFGYIDRTGKLTIPYRFEAAGPFREGLAAVVFPGRCYVESRDGLPRSLSAGGLDDHLIHSDEYAAYADGKGIPASITERCGEGFIDKTGKIVFHFQGARDFSEGFAAVEDLDKWGFIDRNGTFRVSPQFEDVGSFCNGLARAWVDGKWGYIDSAGQWKIRPQFKEADDFSDGLASADSGYIDQSGSRVVNTKGTAFVQGLAHVTLGPDEYGYINHRGKMVFRYRAKHEEPSLPPTID
jgi:hypothetical protein